MSDKKTYGLIAEFETSGEILTAAGKVKENGFEKFDTHTPFPVHGMDDAMGLKPTKLPWISLSGAVFGLTLAVSFQYWMSNVDYFLRIAGRPEGFIPVWVPIMFALTILFTAFATVFGMLGMNLLPRLNHPLFTSENFKRHSDDRFFIAIEAADPKFNMDSTKKFLEEIGGKNIEVIEC